MRYADRPTTSVEIDLCATATAVWSLITDIEIPVRFSPELHRVAWLNGAAAPSPGAWFAGWNKHPVLGTWRTASRVTLLEHHHRFGWRVTDPDGTFGPPNTDANNPLATWCYHMTSSPTIVRLQLSARIGPARSGISLAIDRWPEQEEGLIAHRLAELNRGIQATLAGIKTLAEQASSVRRH